MISRCLFLFLSFWFFVAESYGADIMLDIQQSTSVVAEQEGRLNFTNSDGVGNYQMYPSGRPDWVTIHNNNNQYRSGYLKLQPGLSDIGSHQMVLWSCQNGSTSICSDKKIITIQVTGTVQQLQVSVGNFSWVEYTASTQPFTISGGTPPYTATLSGSFNSGNKPYPLMPEQTLTCDNSSTCLPPLVVSDTAYNFTLSVGDSAGNSVSDDFVITVSDEPKDDAPSPPILNASAIDHDVGKISFNWSASTNNPNWYQLTFIGDGNLQVKRPSPETGFSLELSQGVDGLQRRVEYTVYVQAHNTKGYSEKSNSIKFTLDSLSTNDKPVASCVTCPQSGEVDEQLVFNFKSIEPDSEKVTNTVDWGDGSTYTSSSVDAGEFQLSHAYATEGQYTVAFSTEDSSNQKSDVVTHTITISKSDIVVETPVVFESSFLLGNPNNHAPASSSAGFGVNAVTGNFYYEDLDIAMPGKGLDFAFSRAYNSMVEGTDSFGDSIPEPLGRGWTHSYNILLRVKGTQAEVIWGDGSRDGFVKSGTVWSAVTPDNRYQLSQSGTGWIVTSYKQNQYLFNSAGRLTSITSRHGNSLSFDYDGEHLKQIQDTAGRIVTFNYSGSQLTKMNLPLGLSIQYSYYSAGLLKAVTDRRGNVWRYVYNDDRLRVIHRAGASESAAGDSSNKLLLQVAYDDEGKVKQQDTGHTATTGGAVGTYTFEWSARSMTYNSAAGQGAEYHWDDQLRLTDVIPINAASGTSSLKRVYTKQGLYAFLPDSIKDRSGKTSSFTYDDFDLKTFTDPVQRSSSFSYTAQHDLEQQVSPTGLTTRVDWDSGLPEKVTYSGSGLTESVVTQISAKGNGLLESVQRGGQSAEVTSYDEDGQPLIIELKEGTKVLSKETREYDDLGRLISSKNSLTNRYACFSYDANDNPQHILTGVTGCPSNLSVTVATAAIGHIYFEHDDNNRLTKKVVAYKSSKAQSYTRAYNDNTGVLTRSCHEAGGSSRCQQYSYDADLRLYEVTDESTGRKNRIHTLQSGFLKTTVQNVGGDERRIVRRQYDANGNLSTLSSCTNIDVGKQNSPQADCAAYRKRSQIEYDELNRPKKIYTQLADTTRRATSISYSADGRTVTITEPEGNKTVRESDSLGRLIRVTQSANGQSLTSEYAYDANDNLIEITDPSGLKTTFTYDGLGRRLSRSDLSGEDSWTYSDGLTTIHTEPDGTQVTYKRDAAGNLVQLTTSDGFKATYTYNALGQKEKAVWSGYGKSGERTYQYTAFGELQSVLSPSGKLVEYDYDSIGRLTAKRYADLALQYGYDGLDQLQTLSGSAGDFKFYHDEFTGALLKQEFPNGVETLYERNWAGELLRLSTVESNKAFLDYGLTLDQNGRRSTIQAEQPQALQQVEEGLNFTFSDSGLINKLNGGTVSYDGRSNIVSIPEPFQKDYTYDVFNRVKSSGGISHEYDDSRRRIAKTEGGKTSQYLWDVNTAFGDVVAEYEGNEVQQLYVYGAGGLLAQIDADDNVHYVHQDFNHNVVALTDSSGAVSDSFAWSPYGRAAGRTGTTDIPFGFAGGVGVMTDSEDSIYMRARHYHSGLRQFTSPDLIEGSLLRPQSLNRYAYVEGMAFSGVDPSGLTRLFQSQKDCMLETAKTHHEKTGRLLTESKRKEQCGLSLWEKTKSFFTSKDVSFNEENISLNQGVPFIAEDFAKAKRAYGVYSKYKAVERPIDIAVQIEVARQYGRPELLVEPAIELVESGSLGLGLRYTNPIAPYYKLMLQAADLNTDINKEFDRGIKYLTEEVPNSRRICNGVLGSEKIIKIPELAEDECK